MSEGCTNCGRKGGCDARKHEMFAALDGALARLYPTRRWDQRDDAAAFEGGVPAVEGQAIAALASARLGAAAVHRPGAASETCDYVYLLCVGRMPALAELREEASHPGGLAALRDALADGPITDVYLRVALSTVAGFAAVQEVRLSGQLDAGAVVLTETARAGVFEPALLRRMQLLVAVLAERNVRHLDFGDIAEAPAGFDPGSYADEYGGAPAIANYLFYPQPPAGVTTTTLT
ncbi:MAG TPA: hypothetical protein VMT03_24780 [Polyangia bacterium]|nr:hypothetical protein [Polyangia bacterium]